MNSFYFGWYSFYFGWWCGALSAPLLLFLWRFMSGSWHAREGQNLNINRIERKQMMNRDER